MELVLDLNRHRLKGAFFENDQVTQYFVLPPDRDALKNKLEHQCIDSIFISSIDQPLQSTIVELLDQIELPYTIIDFSTANVTLDEEDQKNLGPDRIANVYGALNRFPLNDCIVVDLGRAVTFDYVSRGGKHLGGAIYPGPDIGAIALSEYSDKLPRVKLDKPLTILSQTTEHHIQSGLYFGLLGAIERITFEMRATSENPSDVKVIATGGLLHALGESDFTKDLGDLVDLIDPALTLIGHHEIMKEKK